MDKRFRAIEVNPLASVNPCLVGFNVLRGNLIARVSWYLESMGENWNLGKLTYPLSFNQSQIEFNVIEMEVTPEYVKNNLLKAWGRNLADRIVEKIQFSRGKKYLIVIYENGLFEQNKSK